MMSGLTKNIMKFVEEYRKLSSTGDDIYGLHGGVEGRECLLKCSELEELCKSHDVMVEALKGCSELFSDIRGDWSDPRYECRSGQELIANALAKAEGAK